MSYHLGFAVSANRNVSDVEMAFRKAGDEQRRNAIPVGGLMGYVGDVNRNVGRDGGGAGASPQHYDAPRLVAPYLGSLGIPGAEFANAALKAGKAERAANKLKRDADEAAQIKSSVKLRKPAKPATVADGKAQTAKLIDGFWGEWNKEVAKFIKPVAGAIDSLPLPSAVKRKLKNNPLDAAIDIFDPILDAVGRAVDRVIKKKGKNQFFFGKGKNIARVQDIDLKADRSTQNLMKKLRTIDAFITLFFTQPIDLTAEMLKEGINIVGSAVDAVGKAAGDFAKFAGETFDKAAKAAKDAADDFADFLGFKGLSGPGLGAAVVDDAAAAAAPAVTAAAGPAIDASILEVLAMITTLITAALGTAAVVFAPKAEVKAESANAAAVGPVGPADFSSGPGPGPGTEPPAAGGIPPIAIAAAAAAAVFLLLRSK